VLEAIANCRDSRGAYRFQNDHQFVIARKPVPAARRGAARIRMSPNRM
jgi:hypothetical protein